MYSESNVAIAATHTHTGPGGYFQYFLYSLAAGGFSPETFTAQVDGILKVCFQPIDCYCSIPVFRRSEQLMRVPSQAPSN